MRWKLDSNLQAMSIVGGILILVGGTILGIVHSGNILGWIAIFPAAGYLFADYMGFHLIFFARKERGLLGWSALICKFLVFGTLFLGGACLAILLITDETDKRAAQNRLEIKKTETDIETNAKVKLIEAGNTAKLNEDTNRAENAAKLKDATGSVRLARAFIVKKEEKPITFNSLVPPSPAPSVAAAATVEISEEKTEQRSSVERFARWYARAPVFFAPAAVGLLSFMFMQVFGKLGENRNQTTVNADVSQPIEENRTSTRYPDEREVRVTPTPGTRRVWPGN